MKAKKVLEFILLRSAFTMKNFSSLGLVALFFGAYVLLGGEGVSIPRLGPEGSQSLEPVVEGAAPLERSVSPEAPLDSAPVDGSPKRGLGGSLSSFQNRSDVTLGGEESAKELPKSHLLGDQRPSTPNAFLKDPSQSSASLKADDQWERLSERLKKLKESQENREDPAQRSEAESPENAISE